MNKKENTPIAPILEQKNVEDLGEKVEDINVQLGAGFLEHFSEQLYSSPNKAFEELVANSWDAGAQTVYIQIPEDLYARHLPKVVQAPRVHREPVV